jgi:hypothetical protein
MLYSKLGLGMAGDSGSCVFSSQPGTILLFIIAIVIKKENHECKSIGA